MGVKGNWGVEITDSIDVYEKPENKLGIYIEDRRMFKGYKSGCGC